MSTPLDNDLNDLRKAIEEAGKCTDRIGDGFADNKTDVSLPFQMICVARSQRPLSQARYRIFACP